MPQPDLSRGKIQTHGTSARGLTVSVSRQFVWACWSHRWTRCVPSVRGAAVQTMCVCLTALYAGELNSCRIGLPAVSLCSVSPGLQTPSQQRANHADAVPGAEAASLGIRLERSCFSCFQDNCYKVKDPKVQSKLAVICALSQEAARLSHPPLTRTGRGSSATGCSGLEEFAVVRPSSSRPRWRGTLVLPSGQPPSLSSWSRPSRPAVAFHPHLLVPSRCVCCPFGCR